MNAVKGLIRLARISAASADDRDFPDHQIGFLGKEGNAIAWYPFGFHANPDKGALAMLFAIGGNPEARHVLPGSPKERIKPLAAGEVVYYHPATGSKVHMRADGSIDIDAQLDLNVTVAGDAVINVTGDADIDIGGSMAIDSVGDVEVTAPNFNVTGDVEIDGDLTVTDGKSVQFPKIVKSTDRFIGDGHFHNDLGAETGRPRTDETTST